MRFQTYHRWQRGATLIIALVFLLVMTLLGTTAMQGTSQQETMAGSMRDLSLAFQAAQSALRAGEHQLECSTNALTVPMPTTTPIPNVPTTQPAVGNFWANTVFSQAPAAANGLLYQNGTTAAPTTGAVFLTQVATQPSYVIEKSPTFDPTVCASTDFLCFRITARGVGGTTNAVVILQSILHYAKCETGQTLTTCPTNPLTTTLVSIDNRGTSGVLSPCP